MTQKTKDFLTSISKGMSGDMRFGNPTGLVKNIVPTIPNSKAAGTMLEQYMVSLEYLVGTSRRRHLWAQFVPLLTAEEFCTDAQIAAPVVSAGPGMSEGMAAIDVTFDTDNGITKTYQAGDAIFVSARALSNNTLLGWPLPKIVRAYFITHIPIPAMLTPAEVLDVTGITYSGVLAGPGAQQQTIRILAGSIDFPVGATNLSLEMGRIEGNAGNVYVDGGVSNLITPYELIAVRFTNGTPLVFNKSGSLSLQYTSPTGPKSLPLTHNNAISVLAGSSKTFFIDSTGKLYLADSISLCRAAQNGAF